MPAGWRQVGASKRKSYSLNIRTQWGEDAVDWNTCGGMTRHLPEGAVFFDQAHHYGKANPLGFGAIRVFRGQFS